MSEHPDQEKSKCFSSCFFYFCDTGWNLSTKFYFFSVFFSTLSHHLIAFILYPVMAQRLKQYNGLLYLLFNKVILLYRMCELGLFRSSYAARNAFWTSNIPIQFTKSCFPSSDLRKHTVDNCCYLISIVIFISLGQQSLSQPYTKDPM